MKSIFRKQSTSQCIHDNYMIIRRYQLLMKKNSRELESCAIFFIWTTSNIMCNKLFYCGTTISVKLNTYYLRQLDKQQEKLEPDWFGTSKRILLKQKSLPNFDPFLATKLFNFTYQSKKTRFSYEFCFGVTAFWKSFSTNSPCWSCTIERRVERCRRHDFWSNRNWYPLTWPGLVSHLIANPS